jgi:AsmA protein
MLKRMVIVAGGLLALLAAALVALVLLVDPNDYKEEIGAYASRLAGRQVNIVDDMRLNVFPWLGVSFGRVTLANAPGFGGEPLAKVDKARINVRLIPLLSRRIELDTVTVEGLELRLEKDRAGRANWEGLGGAGREAGERPAGPAAARPAGEPAFALPAALSVGGLDIRRGALRWRDASSGSTLELTDIALRSGRIAGERPVDLSLSLRLRQPSSGLAGEIRAAARLTARPATGRFEADDVEVDARLEGSGLPADPLAISATGKAVASLGDDTADIPALAVEALGLRLDASARVEHLTARPRAQGRIEVAPFDPRALLEAIGRDGPATADPKALSSAALSLRFDADADGARLEDLQAKLDDATLRGRLTVSDYSAPALGFDLAIDRLDADRYLSPTKAGAAAVPAAPAAALSLPVDTLRRLALQGRLQAGLLKVQGLTLRDLRLEARADKGLLTLAPLSASLYGGRYDGAARIDARTEPPALGLDVSLSDVEAEPLLRDLFQVDLFSGSAGLEAKLAARGRSEPELRRSLSGHARFRLRDGAIKGFNAAQLIREAKARLEGGAAADGAARDTDLTELTASLDIADGVARNDDLAASSPYLRLGGSGQADLVRERIDYRLRARIVDTSVGQGGAGLDDVKGFDIPIRIDGALASPDIGIDNAAVAKLLRDKATKELERKAKKELGKKLDQLLKGLSR